MKLDGYKPKYGQEPEVFNNMYMQFAEGIYNPVDEKSASGAPSDRPYSQQSAVTQSVDDQEDDEPSPAPEKVEKQSSAGSIGSPADSPQQTMINISSCEFAEFQKYMISQYGEQQFIQGYEAIRSNRTLIYQDGGEEMLCQML